MPNADPREDARRADRLEDRIEDMKEVKDVTVVVNSSTAYIGIDMDAKLQGRLTDTLKQKVIDRAKEVDKMLTQYTFRRTRYRDPSRRTCRGY